jgi:PIN domain nuclease of toxin-antitoxin system
MRYLIDTHILLWIEKGSSELSQKVKEELDNYSNLFYVSLCSFYEIAQKVHAGKLTLKVSIDELMTITQKQYSIHLISFEKNHIIEYSRLTLKPGHGDPFDHMIISQAIANKYTLISADRNFSFYRKQGLLLLEND